ncbi:MAG: hypothetical protein AVDCRST_MAG10-1862, partial [uncultured Acidimicrobiales bacterium]
ADGGSVPGHCAVSSRRRRRRVGDAGPGGAAGRMRRHRPRFGRLRAGHLSHRQWRTARGVRHHHRADRAAVGSARHRPPGSGASRRRPRAGGQPQPQEGRALPPGPAPSGPRAPPRVCGGQRPVLDVRGRPALAGPPGPLRGAAGAGHPHRLRVPIRVAGHGPPVPLGGPPARRRAGGASPPPLLAAGADPHPGLPTGAPAHRGGRAGRRNVHQAGRCPPPGAV